MTSASENISTIQNIYKNNNDETKEELIICDAKTRRNFINKSAYAKLHRSLSAGNKRHSVDNLKGRYENLVQQNSDPKPPPDSKEDLTPTKFTPDFFGYPKTANLKPPLIKSKPVLRKNASKDVNSNVVTKEQESDNEVEIVLRQTSSAESVNRIAEELSTFIMDGRNKERKHTSGFRKLFMGGLFSKDKKKKEEQAKSDNIDNLRKESHFQHQSVSQPSFNDQNQNEQELHEGKVKELEQKYAELHVNRFNQIRQGFTEEKANDYLPMDNPKQPRSISDYISGPVNKYIDTSSTASTESEKANNFTRVTPPRAQETYQNFKLVKPKATIPLNSDRPLPNPYQNEKTSPRTIERNLNKSNSKDYPDKANIQEEDTYGTVFDSLEYTASRNGEIKPVNTPKSPSLESTKLRLPPNREIVDLQPRMKSPIPSTRVSTEKLIATELLKNSRSPTPPKRVGSRLSEEVVKAKPPVSPKNPKIVTNAQVHVPTRPHVANYRSATPVELRMSASLKLSPQKKDIKKSVEEYYWKEMKKLKNEEDSKLYSMQMNGYDESVRLRRSRSLSPSQKCGTKNLSLPRDTRPPLNYVDYGRISVQQPIPERRALVVNRQLEYDQNFIRNNPERRSVDSFQRPIFRRGSLNKPEIYEGQNYNKRVSFSNSQALGHVWPTRNGYTQSPPQRRVERLESELEDDVFIPNMEPVYAPRYMQSDPIYSNRVLDQFRAQQNYENLQRQHMDNYGPRRLSMNSLSRRQDFYAIQRPQVPIEETHGQLQHNPVYSSRQSIADAYYGQKQVNVRNKFCDIYGQIHDSAPQTGIVMGQLQNTRMVSSPSRQSYTQPDNFIRGSRLTSSANDIGRRYNDARYYYETNYDKLPLPPLPQKKQMQISDTESASDNSEIQRIMQNKSKPKKRGLFGK